MRKGRGLVVGRDDIRLDRESVFMSDVVTVGIVTAGASVVVSALGYTTTYLVQRKSTNAAIANAREQASVELARVDAENKRLRQEHREAERQNRQDTYHRMLAVLDRFDTLATGYAPSNEQLEDALSEFNFLSGGIELFGTEGVKKAMAPVSRLFEEAGAAMRPEDKVASFRSGYLPLRGSLNEARRDLVKAMGKDITAGIIDN